MNGDETASDLEDYALPSPKRRRLTAHSTGKAYDVLNRPISPPSLKRQIEVKPADDLQLPSNPDLRFVASPVHLTRIRDLSQSSNIDVVSLKDILCDPLIKETWQFNFLFDVDFVMSALDEDVRSSVQVNLVHGFWKKDDPSRLNLQEAASKFPNVKLIAAYLPEMYGTHHSKMMVNLRHDDTAQVIIHTSNMIDRDWANMSQAAWLSPFLPLATASRGAEGGVNNQSGGIGERFKRDLLQYLRAYEGRATNLINELKRYDFQAVRAALVASVPGRHSKDASSTAAPRTLWGLQGLREVLRKIPSSTQSAQRPKVIVQISSIASLRPLDNWFEAFRGILSTTSNPIATKPIFRIVFPTADEVRRSLDGYAAGQSIHTRIEGPAQQKQLHYLRPILCYWAGDEERPMSVPQASTPSTTPVREAGRRRAAPHIKTYVRFADSEMTRIDWAMVTSANLSVQAWGALPDKDSKVRISSYEIGVVVWPALFADMDSDTGEGATTTTQKQDSAPTTSSQGRNKPTNPRQGRAMMVPTFMSNAPQPSQNYPEDVGTVVGFRMPYDLPLTRYAPDEEPWCATSNYNVPDWKGRTWQRDEE